MAPGAEIWLTGASDLLTGTELTPQAHRHVLGLFSKAARAKVENHLKHGGRVRLLVTFS